MTDRAGGPAAPRAEGGSVHALERFLVGEAEVGPAGSESSDALIDVGVIEERGLAPYAYGRVQALPDEAKPDAATQGRLRTAYVLTRARHALVRKATRELLASWHEAGITALLTKGFALAEFVYPDPGWRLYSDVDLAIAVEHANPAADLAPEAGWTVVWRADTEVDVNSPRGSEYQGHELLTLYHQASDTNMDVHRRLVHNNDNRLARWEKQESITRAAWRASQVAKLDGVPVRLLDPRDAALIGLVLNRSWSSDVFQLRLHDYLDLAFLAERAGVTREALEGRAQELGCARTLALFLERCDPYRKHLDLTPPTRAQLLRWDTTLASERGHRGAERLAVNLRQAPLRTLDVLRELPHVARLTARWRNGRPANWPGAAPRHQSASASAAPPDAASVTTTELDRPTWKRVQRAVRRALRVCGVDAHARPDLAIACAHAALVRRGVAAEVRDGPHGLVLLVDGAALDLSGLGLKS
ncbi:MAG: nucleotidyltransferase family protein [Trueperaceae bacterium]